MTGVQYRDEILDVYIRSYAGAVSLEFILMITPVLNAPG
jgi:hypothetical protein